MTHKLAFHLVFFILLSTVRIVNAQNIIWSEPVKNTREVSHMSLIGMEKDGFYVLEESRKEESIRINEYELNGLHIKSTFGVAIPRGDKDARFESAMRLGNEFFVFTSEFNKENEHYQIFCSMYDQAGAKLSDPTLVHSVLAENRESAPQFGIVISPDSTKMLLYFDPPFERKSSESISFKCYDTTLDLLWEKDILLPYTQEIIQVHSFILDNATNVYMMSGRNPAKNSSQWKKTQGGRYVVFFYNPKDKKLKEYDISLKDKQVLSVIFQFNKEQELYIAGYYSNDFHFSAAGTFLFTLGANGNAVKSASFMPFPADFLAKLLRKSEVNPDAALPDFYLDHMFLPGDGTMLLVGEQYYMSEYVMTDPTTGRQTIEYRYNFDDLIVTKLEANGRHAWNTKIPKRQYTSSSSLFCSYQTFLTPTGLNFYFNDSADNMQRLANDKEGEASLWSGSRNCVTSKVALSFTGTLDRQNLFSNKGVDAMLKPSYGNTTGNGPEVLFYDDGKSYRFCIAK